jgi:hypothetical protein
VRADLTRRGRRPATIARKLAAVAVYHRSMDHSTPTDHDVVRAVVRGTRRQLGVAQPQKTALELDALRAVILKYPGGSAGAARSGAVARWLGGRAGRPRCAAASSSRSRSAISVLSRRGSCSRSGARRPIAKGPAPPCRSRLEEKKRRVRSGRCVAGWRPRRSGRGESFVGSIGMGISGRPYRIGRWRRSWRPAPPLPDLRAISRATIQRA